MSPEGDDGAAGAQNAPLKSVAAAAKKATDGTTIVLKSGVYREPHFSITKSNVTLQAAPHAEVWLKGSDVVGASRWKKDGRVWKVTGDFQNFCHVCTVNPDPRVDGMAAFPEQVFIDDQPLKQVDSKDKVGPGTFYVEDATPTTLKVADDRTKGYNVGKQDSITYYVGSDPTAGTTEISQRSRAFTSTGSGLAMKGVNVAQFAPNHAWDFNDPRLGKESGPVAVSVNGAGSVIQDGVFAQSSSTGFFFDHAENSRFVNNKVYDNGATGLGGNRTHGTTVEKSVFSASNAAGMEIDGTKCKGYCTRQGRHFPRERRGLLGPAGEPRGQGQIDAAGILVRRRVHQRRRRQQLLHEFQLRHLHRGVGRRSGRIQCHRELGHGNHSVGIRKGQGVQQHRLPNPRIDHGE